MTAGFARMPKEDSLRLVLEEEAEGSAGAKGWEAMYKSRADPVKSAALAAYAMPGCVVECRGSSVWERCWLFRVPFCRKVDYCIVAILSEAKAFLVCGGRYVTL